MFLHLGSMRSNRKFKKDLNILSMKRGNTRLNELSVLANMKLHKNKLEESPSVRSLVSVFQKKVPLLVNTKLSQRSLKGLNILCMRSENIRSNEQSDQANMKLLMNKLEESLLVRSTEKDSQKTFQLLVNTRLHPRFKKVHNTQSTKRENIRLREQWDQENMRLHKNNQEVSPLVRSIVKDR
jgi:hypothetical protein